jgi:hypothetical protein
MKLIDPSTTGSASSSGIAIESNFARLEIVPGQHRTCHRKQEITVSVAVSLDGADTRHCAAVRVGSRHFKLLSLLGSSVFSASRFLFDTVEVWGSSPHVPTISLCASSFATTLDCAESSNVMRLLAW